MGFPARCRARRKCPLCGPGAGDFSTTHEPGGARLCRALTVVGGSGLDGVSPHRSWRQCAVAKRRNSMNKPTRSLELIVWGGLALVMVALFGAYAVSRFAANRNALPMLGNVSGFALTNQFGR